MWHKMHPILTLEGSPTDSRAYTKPPWWQVRKTFIDCESNIHRMLYVRNHEIDSRLVVEFLCEAYA